MSYTWIETEFKAPLARILLNRPDVLNSFTIPMAEELQDALQKAADDPQIRAVLLSGNGRGFCAGQDLAEAVAPDGPGIREIVNRTYNPLIRMIRNIEKPVICAVNGVAAGAGANIAFACDITIASEQASFIQAFSKIGLIPDSAGTFFLPRNIGLQRATAITMLGDKISAHTAKEWGLIWDVCSAEELLTKAEELAMKLAAMPTRALGLTKKAMNQSWNHSLEQQLELEGALQEEAANTLDHKEGVQAFLEKRKPNFTGQ